MRSLVVAVALLAAACTSQTPPSNPPAAQWADLGDGLAVRYVGVWTCYREIYGGSVALSCGH